MAVKLIPVESAWMDCDAGVVCEGESGPLSLPVATWLVIHPGGSVLFDTGLHKDLIESSDRIGPLADVFAINMQHDLGEAISLRGIDPAEIDYVVFSHLHFDHCGGTHAVPNARLVVQKAEWAAGHDSASIERGVYSPADFDIGHDVQMIEGEHDIFGDGSVVCIPTPGHTPGHQSLRVVLESGPVLLTGDCCYWKTMLDNDQVPPFGFDIRLQRESMKMLRQIQSEGVRLLFGHDPNQWRSVVNDELT